MTDLTARWQAALMPNYGTPPLELARGEGVHVWDTDGDRYLDLLAGIAVNVLGHAHPAVTRAVTEQVNTLGHVSNLFIAEPPVRLAERLLELLGVHGDGRVLLTNSGAEANEAAFKIARRTGRGHMVSTHGGFHGRTMGALAVTGQPAKQHPFEPLPAGVSFVPYGDVDALCAAVDSDTAAVFVEPIQGENGVVVPPHGYLAAAREITHRSGALLVVDEVQTGIGRTGAWFAHEHAGIRPDVVTLAKGLGGGLPIGACIGIGEVGTLLAPGQHGTTFGGNPVCCAAALAVLATVGDEKLTEHAATLGGELAASIEALHHPLVDHVRGAGLLRGIVLTERVAAAAVAAARRHGFLINMPVPGVLRLAPPLILRADQAREFLAALPGILDEARGAEG